MRRTVQFLLAFQESKMGFSVQSPNKSRKDDEARSPLQSVKLKIKTYLLYKISDNVQYSFNVCFIVMVSWLCTQGTDKHKMSHAQTHTCSLR